MERQEELFSFVEMRLWQGAFQDDTGPFEAWCRTVMRNHLIDLSRKERRTTELSIAKEPNDPTDNVLRQSMEQEQDWRAPFTQADLDRIRAIRNPIHRVILLSRSLLSGKVPGEEWNAWLAEVDLLPPFPPNDFPDWCPVERNQFVADELGIPLNTMHRIWARHREVLLQMAFVQDLLP